MPQTPLSRNLRSGMGLHERVSHSASKRLKFLEAAMIVTRFKFGEDRLIVGVPCRNQVIEDPREFVRGIFNGDRSAVAGPLGAVIIAEVGFVVVKRLGSHAK